MKLLLTFVCAFFVCAALSPAQTPAPSAQVVTVSFSNAVLQTAEAQHQFALLKIKYAARQAELEALDREVESLRKQLSGNTDKLREADRQSREKLLDTKQKQLQRQTEDFRNDTESDSQQAFQQVAQKMFTFLQSYAQRHNYALVQERGPDTAPAVWYAASGLDITADLTKAFDEQTQSTPRGQTPASDSSLPSAPSAH